MHAIRSEDGTPIRYFRRGHGPAILLIHGTAADHSRWPPVISALLRHFTVYAMDRRGRGGRGDAGGYRMEDEFADVAAVVGAIDGSPVDVVGHSYGGICAMESVFRKPSIRRLVLYEPPIAVLGGGNRAVDAIANVRRLIAEGEREGALVYFYGQIAQIPPRALTAMRALPDWTNEGGPHRAARARRHGALRAAPGAVPQLEHSHPAALGGDSPPVYRAGIERMQAILPGSEIAVLKGQGHMAMKTAPKLFVREIVEFLGGMKVGRDVPGRGGPPSCHVPLSDTPPADDRPSPPAPQNGHPRWRQ